MMQDKSGKAEPMAQLFPMSPMISAKQGFSNTHNSPSLAVEDKQEEGSAMSIDSSNTSSTQRAPFGEVQVSSCVNQALLRDLVTRAAS